MVNVLPAGELRALSSAVQYLVVLVVSEREEIAKRIESYMRNAGHPVRAAWVTDLEDIQEALSRGAPDLLLCAEGLLAAPLRSVVTLSARLCPDLPVLLLASKHSQEETVAALTVGAKDQVSYEDLRQLRHLELVMMREFVTHHALRELRNTRTRLADFESRHLKLLAGTNDAVAQIHEGILSHVNPAFATLLGYAKPEDLIGLPIMDLVTAEHGPKAKEHLRQLSKGKVDGKAFECDLKKQDGSHCAISARLTCGTVDGESFIEMLIRADTAAAAPAPVSATVSQPGAPDDGRSAFIGTLGMRLRDPPKGANGVLFLVVDEYATLEERLGFKDTEELVLKVRDWLKSRLTATDLVYRFSTSELVAVIHRNTVPEIEQLAERLTQEIPTHIFNLSGHEAQLTMSITAYPFAGGEHPTAVINELGREARKLSVRGGRQHQVLGATAKASSVEREEARRAAMVKRAMEENRLKLAYQSIASLEGDTRQHFDVLVRMMDEQGKEVHASEFIPAAEKFGLMRVVDRWVTTRVLKLIAKRESAHEASSLFIKISEETLKDSDSYLAWLKELTRERPFKPDEVVFEFREIHLQNHIRKAMAFAQALKQMGASIAIEHYGTATNSQQMMEHVPTQFIKFHRDFTQKFNDKDLQRKMSQLMEVAKQKKIKTIVCHVEDANVMARLWQMGVNYIQGYHVQEPEVVLLSTDIFGTRTTA